MTSQKATRNVVAIHEAGHAVAARLLGIGVTKLTLRPTERYVANVRTRTAAFAAARQGGSAEMVDALYRDLQVALAGIAAQEIAGCPNEGGSDVEGDLSNATNCAAMIARVKTGLPMLGAVTLEVGDPLHTAGCAELERAYADVVKLLQANWPAVERVVHALQTRDVLLPRKLDQLIGQAACQGTPGAP